MEKKDLGVWTDDKLEFTEHIGRVCMKGNHLLGLVKKKRSFVHKDPDIVKKLYATFGICKCCLVAKVQKDIQRIEKVQTRATELVGHWSRQAALHQTSGYSKAAVTGLQKILWLQIHKQ